MPLIWCHMGEPCVPSARSKGNDSTWRREPVSLLRNAVFFSSNHQKSCNPGEPVSGYLDCLGGMELALDLTEEVPPCQPPRGEEHLSDGANSCSDCSWLAGGGSRYLTFYSNLPLHQRVPHFLMLQSFKSVPRAVVMPPDPQQP